MLARINEAHAADCGGESEQSDRDAGVAREICCGLRKPRPQAALLVDEAYFEFCGETLMTQWREVPNLFVSRTFSKAYGLAGLRIGVLAGNAEQMQMVRRVSSPYNLNSVALACLPEALADQEYVRDYVEEVLRGRERLESELQLARHQVLAEPGEFCADVFRSGESGVYCGHATSVAFWCATARAIRDARDACASRWDRRTEQ